MIFLVTAEGVVAVDAPPTIGNNILRAIATVTKAQVTHAIYSHHHADHTGAMVLYKGARLYAQSDVAGLLRQTRDPNRPLPQVTFDDKLTVTAGEDRIELAYHGPNHSPGNIFTYLPAQRVLMLVDVVFPGWVPFAYLAESQNIPGWLEAPAQALGYPFHTFVGGHLTRLGTRDDVTIQQEYVADLKAAAANAIGTFNVETVYESVDAINPWAIFRGYLDGVAAQASDAVVPAGPTSSAAPMSTPRPTPTSSSSRCGSTTGNSARSVSIPRTVSSSQPAAGLAAGPIGGFNRSWALSNSEHCLVGGPERSWVTWSGGVAREAVTVFRHGRGCRWAWRDPPSLLTRPARGRSGGSSHGPILWPGSCHTCASSRPRTFCVLPQDSTRARYRVREITICRTVPYPAGLDAEFFPAGDWRSILVVKIGHPGESPWFDRLPRLDYEEAVRHA